MQKTRAKQSAPEFVRDGLRKLIIQGKYEGGEFLRQDELAKQFGTSRIPVREALRQLETEGLVELQANRGAVVSSSTIEDVLEMMEIRLALETRALRIAIPNMSEEDFDQAAGILRNYDREPSAKGWGIMNLKFHEVLYAPCNLPKLIALIRNNNALISRYERVKVSIAAGKDRPQREHYQILDACRQQNVSEAVALLEKHIVQTQKSVQAASRRPIR